ncbi:MAG TPA: hypothetical protein VGS19_09480 [Streptosporangiaceae bacterium]|nr:hypothetical protein [Streptosporangiaceae bacterium]
MAVLIALAVTGLFSTGVITAIIGVLSVAILREDKNLTLTREAPDTMTRAARWVNGVYSRAPLTCLTAVPDHFPGRPPLPANAQAPAAASTGTRPT